MADKDIFRPEWLAFEQELGFRPLLPGPTYPDIVKQNASNALALMDKYDSPRPDPTVQTKEERTPSGVRLKIYTPPNVRPNQPVVLYLHGGGCVFGSVDEDDAFVCRYATDSGLVFVSCEYRLAPNCPYPDGFRDCIEAATWCIENAKSLHNQACKVLPMGVSAGATLAIATALNLCREGRKGELEGVVAIQPFTLHPDFAPPWLCEKYTSYDEHDGHTINSKATMKTFFDLHGAPKNDPYIYPALNSRLKDLPCVYLSACENDTLRDDARILKKLMDRYGVPNEYDEYAKLPHFFFAYPSKHLDGVREKYFAKTKAGISFVVDSSVQSPLPLS